MIVTRAKSCCETSVLTFAVDVPTPYGAPEHRKPLPMSPKGRGRIPRLAPGTGMYRGRANGQRREAQEKGAIRGRAFFDYFLCADKESSLPRVSHPQVMVSHRARRAPQSFGDYVAALVMTVVGIADGARHRPC